MTSSKADSVELAQISLHEKLHHTTEEKETIQTDAVHTTSTRRPIHLGNFMLEINRKNRYEYSPRIFASFVVTIWLFVSFFLEGAVIQICIDSLILLFCVAIIIYSIRSGVAVKATANRLLGLPYKSVSDEFEFRFLQYYGLLFLFVVAYSTFISIIDEATDDIHKNPSKEGIFAQRSNTLARTRFGLDLQIFTRTWPLVVNGCLVLFSKHVRKDTLSEITEYRQRLMAKHQNLTVIQERIDETLKDWKKRQYPMNRKREFVILFVVILGTNYTGALYDWEIYNHRPSFFVVETIIFVLDALVGAAVLMSLHSVYLYYRLGWIVMAEFGRGLNATCMDDLIGWWEFRKFYSNCIVQAYLSSLSMCIGSVLIGCIIIIGFLIIDLIVSNLDFSNPDGHALADMAYLVVYCAYGLVFALLLINNATKYHDKQLSHVEMINRESIGLEMDNLYSNDEYALKSLKATTNMHLLDTLKHDITHNSHVMKVFGCLSLNSRFMILMRGSVVSVVIAVSSIIIRQNK
eukprot:75850_1